MTAASALNEYTGCADAVYNGRGVLFAGAHFAPRLATLASRPLGLVAPPMGEMLAYLHRKVRELSPRWRGIAPPWRGRRRCGRRLERSGQSLFLKLPNTAIMEDYRHLKLRVLGRLPKQDCGLREAATRSPRRSTRDASIASTADARKRRFKRRLMPQPTTQLASQSARRCFRRCYASEKPR